MRISLVCGLLLALAAPAAAQNSILVCPLNVFQQDLDLAPTCNPADTCLVIGAKIGTELDPTTTSPADDIWGASIYNRGGDSGDVDTLKGIDVTQVWSGGDDLTSMVGYVSNQTIDGVGTNVFGIAHFVAGQSLASATCTVSYGVLLDGMGSSCGTNYSLHSSNGDLLMVHAGRVAIGGTGNPTTGYDLDVQGPLLVNGAFNMGQPTSTPAATPTATSATPTATAATPTPTATSTPDHLVKGLTGIDGKVHHIGNADTGVQVGPCTKAPCAGRDYNIDAGAAVRDGIGGDINLTSGASANLKPSGNITGTIGSGGAGFVWTARRGLFNIGGLFKVFGDVVLGVAAGGSRPTYSAGCGSTASDALATNNLGRVATTGTGQTNVCVITFANGGFTNVPYCQAQLESSAATLTVLQRFVPTTTTLTVTNYTVATGLGANYGTTDIIAYNCFGRE